MVERIFTKLDALNCKVEETTTQSKVLTVDGVMAQRIQTKAVLDLLDKAIVEMKAKGCDFSKHDKVVE